LADAQTTSQPYRADTPFPEGDEPIDLNMIRRRDAWASPPELKAAGERSTADGK
jgi:hypothetical protein